MIVSDLMSRNPICVTPETSVTDARALMTREKINKLPVLNRDNKLVGLVTKNDLVKAAPSAATTLDMYELSYLIAKLKVEKVMTKELITVSPDEVVEEAARIMVDRGIGCLPVVDDDVLVGIITATDLFKKFIDLFGARHHGVRVTIEMDEKPGALARAAAGIAEIGGNIISMITSDGETVEKRCVTCKVERTTMENVRKILEAADAKIVDIREI